MYDKNKIHQAVLTLDWHGLHSSARAIDRLGRGEIEEIEWRDISAKEFNEFVASRKEAGFKLEDWDETANYLYTVRGEIRKGKYLA